MSIKRENNLRPSIIFLLLANLVPVYGVVFLQWDIYTIFILYWLESAVVAFYNVLKMKKVEKLDPRHKEKLKEASLKTTRIVMIVIFIVHFSIFMMGHLTFINVFFSPGLKEPTDFISGLLSIWDYWSSIFISLAFIFASHGFSFIFNFVKKQEYKKVTLSQQMVEPYKRIIVMHVTIIAVGFATAAIHDGQNIAAILILVFFKIVMDIGGHIKEHRPKYLAKSDLHKG